jgi:hypothetical protein
VLAFFLAILTADRYVDLRGQLLLGLATWVVLLAALRPLPTDRRLQTLLVIVAATCMEVVGSIIWGVYTYRLHNLPLFVPPGHGLVYLSGMRLSETRLAAGNRRVFITAVAVCAAGWALAGLTFLPQRDVSGAIGTAVFLVFLLRGRVPAVYAGVFCIVGCLELAGTASGVWRWHELVPGLQLPSGNPPSGAASGYVLFDIVAIGLSARLLLALRPAASPA